MKTFMMIDLFSGLGGASQAMKDHEWEVVRVDIDSTFKPDVLCDVVDFRWEGRQPDLLWASPPCTDFARDAMPWTWTGKTPDMSLILQTIKIINKINPKYWIIENVKGAIKWFYPYLGKPSLSVNPFFFWGFFPEVIIGENNFSRKERLSSKKKAERARIPYTISNAFRRAIEEQDRLL